MIEKYLLNSTSGRQTSNDQVSEGSKTNRKSEPQQFAKLLVEKVSYLNSVSLAFSFSGGILDEELSEVGISHLVEHLLFKCNNRYSSLEIAQIMDELGGEVNAFTDVDSLCVYGSCPKENFEQLYSLLESLILDFSFRDLSSATDTNLKTQLEKEKEVIRQEIIEAEDDPAEVAYKNLYQILWKDSVLACPVFGTLNSVANFDAAHVHQKTQTILNPAKLIIGVIGDVNVSEVRELSENFVSKLLISKTQEPPIIKPHIGKSIINHSTSQAHIYIGKPWFALNDENYIQGLIISSILGGGAASRLFLKLREEHSLTYDISSTVDSYQFTSALITSSVVERNNLEKTLSIIKEEFLKISKNSITDPELSRTVKSIKAVLKLEQDNIQSRLWKLIETERYFGRYIDSEEIVTKLDKITLSEINELSESRFSIKDVSLSLNCVDPEKISFEFND